MTKQIDYNTCIAAVNAHFNDRKRLLTDYVSRGLTPDVIASDVVGRITARRLKNEPPVLRSLTEYGVAQWVAIVEEYHANN